jgi:hypothetical protein
VYPYEVTTIGGVRVPSSGIRAVGSFLPLDPAKLSTPEVIAAGAAGLVVGVLLGALFSRRKK